MNNFFYLFWARTKEFYRDKGALAWSFILPFFLVATLYFAFQNDKEILFKVVLVDASPTQLQALATIKKDQMTRFTVAQEVNRLPVRLLTMPALQWLEYRSLDRAIDQLRNHQVELVIQNSVPLRYWVNENSSRGAFLEQWLNQVDTIEVQRQPVSGKKLRYIDWAMPGVLGMNMMFSALFGVGYVVVRYRKNGVLKRLKATPVNAYQFLAAQMLSRLMIILIVTSIIFMGCKILLNFLALGSHWLLLIIAILGGLCLISLSLVVAARTQSEELAGGLLNFISWPMLFLSNVWFSLEDADPILQRISQLLPLTHIVESARAVMLEQATLTDIDHHLWALILMTAIFLIIASRLFRWQDQ